MVSPEHRSHSDALLSPCVLLTYLLGEPIPHGNGHYGRKCLCVTCMHGQYINNIIVISISFAQYAKFIARRVILTFESVILLIQPIHLYPTSR